MKSKISLKVALFFGITILGFAVLNACSGTKPYSKKGTVQNIEFGKDGYTAYLKDKNGNNFDAIISRVRMEKNYQTLKAGDQVTLYGDTIHLGNKVRVLVKTIK